MKALFNPIVFIILLCFSVHVNCFSQQAITVQGKVVDDETGAPLAYATVSLKNSNLGTVSNNDGEFEFYIPSERQSDTLYISMVGRIAYEKVVSQLEDNQYLNIRLKSDPVVLDEVIIEGSSISANEIFEKAFQNVRNTFPQQPYLLRGFYRQMNTENDKYVLLVEGAVNVFDKKNVLNKNFNLKERVSINHVRSSNSLFKNTNQNYFEKSNTLTWLLLFNYTKYRNRYVMERTNFEMDSVVTFNERSYYIISSTERAEFGKNTFTMYIDTESFAFLRIKNETTANKGYYLQNFDVSADPKKTTVLKLTASSQNYQFKEYNGKMYLELAESYSKGEIINTKTNNVEWTVTDENLLVINEVTTQNAKRPPEGQMDDRKNIRYLAKDYNPKFWDDYKLINLTPLTKKQISDLEEATPLEEQFKSRK